MAVNLVKPRAAISFDYGGHGALEPTHHVAAMVAADPGLQAFQYELMLESRRRPEIRPMIGKVYEHYRQAARDGLRRMGIDDPAVGDMVFATLDGLVFQQVTFGDVAQTERATSQLRHLLRLLAQRAAET